MVQKEALEISTAPVAEPVSTSIVYAGLQTYDLSKIDETGAHEDDTKGSAVDSNRARNRSDRGLDDNASASLCACTCCRCNLCGRWTEQDFQIYRYNCCCCCVYPEGGYEPCIRGCDACECTLPSCQPCVDCCDGIMIDCSDLCSYVSSCACLNECCGAHCTDCSVCSQVEHCCIALFQHGQS